MGPQDTGAIGEAIHSLLGNRRAIQTIVKALIGAVATNRSYRLPTVRAVLSVLDDDRLVASLAVDLAIKALPMDELYDYITRRTSKELDIFDAGVLSVAVSVTERLGGSRFMTPITPAPLRSYRIRRPRICF